MNEDKSNKSPQPKYGLNPDPASKRAPVSFGKPAPEELTRDPRLRFRLMQGDAVSGPAPVKDPLIEENYPLVLLFLSDPGEDPKKPRQGATLTFTCEGGLFKAGLNDRDNLRTLWRTASGFLEVLQAIEDELNEEYPAWRKYKPWDGGKGKGR